MRRSLFLSIRDRLVDVSIELSSRLSRTVLMVSAVAFSTGALLASVGIAQNAAHQVDADIAASTTRLVLVTVPDKTLRDSPGEEGSSGVDTLLPTDTEKRILALDNVEAVGRRLDVNTSGGLPIAIDRPATGATSVNVGVKSATSGYLEAADIPSTGTLAWMLDGEHHVAFLGESAADTLGIPVTEDTDALSITLNNINYSIIGFLPGDHAFSDSVVIPYANGLQLVGNDRYTDVLIYTALGAGNQISRVARVAILPATPEKLAASQVVVHEDIRKNVSSQLTRQAAWIGGFLIVLTVLLITNSMVVSVTARTTEIGVRRALGSSRSSVASVFWFEGALIGALGGFAGATLSAITVTAVAIINGWTAYLDPTWIAMGPILGLTVGIIASAYPALRASSIHPAIAVRSD